MHRLFIKPFFWIVFFVGMMSHAQEVITKNLGELASLPDNEFYDVLYDSHGNYWFCADSGLYRFDGIHFTQYTNPAQRSQSLFNLKEDDYGRIWCNSLSGQFFVVNPEKDRLELFIDAKDQLIGNLPKYELYKDNLIVQLDNGKFLQYNFKTKERTVLLDNVGVHSDIVRIQSKLFYVSNKLHYFDLITKKDRAFPLQFKYEFVNLYKIDNELYIICADNEHKIVALYVLRNDTLQQIQLPNDFHLRIYELNKNQQGSLFFATEKGVKVMEERNLSLHSKFSILKKNKVSKIIRDSFGNYIFTTLNSGIHYWNGQENFQYNSKNFNIDSEDLNLIHQINKKEFLVTDFSNTVYKLSYHNNFQLQKKWQLDSRIRRLYTFENNSYIISNDSPLFYIKNNTNYNATKKIFASIKDIDIHDKTIYVADTYRLASVSIPFSDSIKKVYRKKRCLSVRYFDGTLYGAFADGTFTIENNNYTPVTYQGEVLYTDRLLSGTNYLWAFKKNQGLLLRKKQYVSTACFLTRKKRYCKKVKPRDICAGGWEIISN
jgi:hypothetical protein